MNCTICGMTIIVEPSGWAEGHNAEPVVRAGRCCSDCNTLVVIPRRMDALKEQARIAGRIARDRCLPEA